MQTVISEEALAIIEILSGFISYILLIIIIIRRSKYNNIGKYKVLNEKELEEFTKGLEEEYEREKQEEIEEL